MTKDTSGEDNLTELTSLMAEGDMDDLRVAIFMLLTNGNLQDACRRAEIPSTRITNLADRNARVRRMYELANSLDPADTTMAVFKFFGPYAALIKGMALIKEQDTKLVQRIATEITQQVVGKPRQQKQIQTTVQVDHRIYADFDPRLLVNPRTEVEDLAVEKIIEGAYTEINQPEEETSDVAREEQTETN
jgi:hypothetical protein